jgi:hypothetical protein
MYSTPVGNIAVVSGLPMVDAYGQKHNLTFKDKMGVIESGNNIFHLINKGLDTRLILLSDQPNGGKKDDEVIFHPQLFLDGVEVKPVKDTPVLLELDPVNPNYSLNTLEWDYKICKRRIRIIEGRFLGSWVFLTNPHGTVRIKYNQYNRAGSYWLRLGQFKVEEDEEIIPREAFERPLFNYPFTICDTATFYPDASPETSTVDGDVRRVTTADTWADLKAGAGTTPIGDDSVNMYCYMSSSTTTNYWRWLMRAVMLFDTFLGAGVVVARAVLSLYAQFKTDELGFAANYFPNIYSSNPASNTALVAADYGTLGSTAFATAIGYNIITTGTYNDFIFNASGIAAINTTGISKFGIRDSYYDAGSNTPTWSGGDKATGIHWYTADQGAGYKPKLIVTSYIPAYPIIGGGHIIGVGGRDV